MYEQQIRVSYNKVRFCKNKVDVRERERKRVGGRESERERERERGQRETKRVGGRESERERAERGEIDRNFNFRKRSKWKKSCFKYLMHIRTTGRKWNIF